ncbi:hypothetical protein NP233_g4052 [Leucocoprinus birnbaumii]|uniref:G domain-containing protein n=1 Tax=Leucocoprinus birnbaumii TaxID=56174 RepID=A0AAD5VZ52_9AGAR|nr:hypothetical protein NP233_g4052 [Leucocoprinus birnbaumii]
MTESIQERANIVDIQDLRQDDIVIALMGPTGAGKSHFIDLLTGQEGQRSGDGLMSKTQGIEATRVQYGKYGDRIVLVDTPGFDDTMRKDEDILQMISDWLSATYEHKIMLSGLIYLHRIIDPRVAGSSFKNLDMFARLCGDRVMSRVIMVTTMWDCLVEKQRHLGDQREDELKGHFWKPLIENESQVARLEPADATQAWAIVEGLINVSRKREPALLQEEIVDLKRKLYETQAGQVVYKSLRDLLRVQMQRIEPLLNQQKGKEELIEDFSRLQQEFQRTFAELDELKAKEISFGSRLVLMFLKRGARAKAVLVPREGLPSPPKSKGIVRGVFGHIFPRSGRN